MTDIDLSLDDKYLYVACFGLGEMHQYDVSDPMNPVLTGKVELGGIAKGKKHPNGNDRLKNEFIANFSALEASRA